MRIEAKVHGVCHVDVIACRVCMVSVVHAACAKYGTMWYMHALLNMVRGGTWRPHV